MNDLPKSGHELSREKYRPWGWLLYTSFLCIWFIPPRILAHLSLKTNDLDFGLYLNLVSNLARGEGFWSSILGRNHLGEHFSPIIILFVPTAWLGLAPWALLVSQGLAAVVTLLILTHMAHNELSPLPKRIKHPCLVALVLFFLFYRPFIAAWDFQFQPLFLGAPFVAGALWAMTKNRWKLLWIFIPFILLTRESAGLSVMGLGLVARYHREKSAPWIMLIGALIPLVLIAWFIPWQRAGFWEEHFFRFAPLSDPLGKSVYFLKLLGPLALLPLFAWKEAIGALPGFLLNVSVGFSLQYSCDLHYDGQLSVFLMWAAVKGIHPALAMIRQIDKGKARWGRAVFGLCMVTALFAQVHWQSSHPIRRYVKFWPTARQAEIRRQANLLANLPSHYLLSADPWIGPHLCQRKNYKTLYHPDWPKKLDHSQIIILQKGDTTARKLIRQGVLIYLAETKYLVLLAENHLQNSDMKWLRAFCLDHGWQ